MYNKILIAIALVMLATGVLQCSSEEDKLLIGTWSIDHIVVQGKTMEINYLSNLLIFDRDGSCIIPITELGMNNEGNWNIEETSTKLILNISAPGNGFEGQYELVYWNDFSNNQVKCDIISEDDKKHICTKALTSL